MATFPFSSFLLKILFLYVSYPNPYLSLDVKSTRQGDGHDQTERHIVFMLAELPASEYFGPFQTLPYLPSLDLVDRDEGREEDKYSHQLSDPFILFLNHPRDISAFPEFLQRWS